MRYLRSFGSILFINFALGIAGHSVRAQFTQPESITLHPTVVSTGVRGFLPSLRGAMSLREGIGAERSVRPLRQTPLSDGPGRVLDTALQSSHRNTYQNPSINASTGGVGNGMQGFQMCCAPPDTTGAIGLNHYVQWVNLSFAVFDVNRTTGTLTLKTNYPKAGNTLFSSLGSNPCATRNDGDPIVLYDRQANRWVLSQFAVPGGSAGYWQCVAVSTTSDPTGAYNVYAFQQQYFNDYPKIGIWPDGYYVTYNMFTRLFKGPCVCSMERSEMIAGRQARQICFQLSTSYASLLPADLDGSTLPPSGRPNYLLARSSGSLRLWKFLSNWTTPANSTLTGPITVSGVASFSAACSGGACIPQPGTSQKLDSLADRLMYRLAYRNLNGTETLVVNHSVVGSNNNSAIRWYEIRTPNFTPTVYQQGTYSPDSKFRWMGSVAMDKMGNIAVGYSVSSNSVSSPVKPSLYMASRLSTDTSNVLSNETLLKQGGGSQTSSLSRWGDYSHMSIDPVDDCTFWYTGEYLTKDGNFNWSTWISSFKLSTCN